MKKQYTAPYIQVVELDSHDLIATSNLRYGEGPGSGSVGAPLRDDDDWSLEDW